MQSIHVRWGDLLRAFEHLQLCFRRRLDGIPVLPGNSKDFVPVSITKYNEDNVRVEQSLDDTTSNRRDTRSTG